MALTSIALGGCEQVHGAGRKFCCASVPRIAGEESQVRHGARRSWGMSGDMLCKQANEPE